MSERIKADDTKGYIRRRRVLDCFHWLSFWRCLSGSLTLSIMFCCGLIDSPEEFKAYIESFGWKGRFVYLGLQCLQVIVALIPGEIIEVGAGYAFGPIEGTLLCMAGVAIASSIVFALTKRWGVRLAELFITREKINELRFINSERKLKRMTFILFFIPGTPKDLFTYFFGLTQIRLHEFLSISIIARIPSVISSTIGGHIIGSKNYLSAAVLFAVTGMVSLAGMTAYSRFANRKREQHDSDKTQK